MSREFQIKDGNLIASFDLENEDGDIDFCKLLKVSHGVADEIGMFVDYVAINKIIKDQSKRIADLEAKLAESEEKYKKAYREGLLQKQFDKDMEIVELKQQLHQIYSHLGVEAYCEDIHEQALKEIGRLQEQLAEKDNKIQMLNAMIATLPEHDKELKEICNQDKISFCIERLEKVKELMCKECECVGECYDENYYILYQHQIKKIIDNQIEELKKGL